ncbi:MAG: dTDP-4-dehydrorhamnose reductase, partial [Lentisphaeria bacterium]
EVFDFPKFDITCDETLISAVSGFDTVVNCAAYTNVDKAEDEPELANEVNHLAVAKLAKLCKELEVYLIHISTDFVFDGSNDLPWQESDQAKPLSVYGETKYKGEQALLNINDQAAVIRVQWTYGNSGINFISKICDWATKLDTIKVVDDQIGSPTPTTSVAQAIVDFIEKQPAGLFHFAAEGYASRFETAKLIIETLKLPTNVIACASTEFTAKATRPLNSRFDCHKIDAILSFERPNWRDALTEYLKNTQI